MLLSEEEKKKREEEAKKIIGRQYKSSSIKDTNNKFTSSSDDIDEGNYNKKIIEAKNIINSINPHKDISTSNEDIEDTNLFDDESLNAPKQEEQPKRRFELINTDNEFSDGFQWSDIPKTISGTYKDIKQDLTSGASSIIEAPIDIGANLLATLENMLGFKEQAKKTREWANKDYSKKAGNFIANTSFSPFKNLENLIKGNLKDVFENEDFEKSSLLGKTSDEVVNLLGYTAGLAAGGAGLKAIGVADSVAVPIAGHTLDVPLLAISGGTAGGLREANEKGENVSEWERWTKGISSGLIEGVTEGIFGLFGIGGNDLTDKLIKKATEKISSSAGKTLAKIGIQAGGEATEEFLSYLGNYIVDNQLINRLGDTDFSSKWDWGDVGEQMALAFASTAIGAGGSVMVKNNSAIESAENQLGRKLTNDEKAKVTQDVINAEIQMNEARELDPEGDGKHVINAYVSNFDNEGNIVNIENVLGKVLNNPNKNINVQPAIFQNKSFKTYNVVDVKTGIVLDNTQYRTVDDAEIGFKEKMTSLDKQAVNGINEKITNASLTLYNQLYRTLGEQFATANIDDINNTKIRSASQLNENSSETNLEPQAITFSDEEIKNVTEAFGEKQDYSKSEIANIWDTIVENKNDVVLDENGNIQSYLDIDDDGNNIVISRYDGNDNVISTSTISNTDGKFSSEEIRNSLEELGKFKIENNINKIANETGVSEVINQIDNKSKYTNKETMNILENVKDKLGSSEIYNKLDLGKLKYSGSEIKGMVNEILTGIQEEQRSSQKGKTSKVQEKQTNGDKLSTVAESTETSENNRVADVGKSKNNTSNKKVNYTGNSALTFEEQVDKWKNGEYNKDTHLVVLKETPKLYQDIGIANLPITVTASKLDRIYNEKGNKKGRYHGLKENVKQLPNAIENPLNIVESTTDPNSVVIIIELADNDDNIVVVSLKLNGNGQIEIDNANKTIISNVMTSAYGRENYDYQTKPVNGSYKGWMQENFENNRIIYDIDEGIKKRLNNGQWLELPNPDTKSSTTKTNGSVINNSITQNVENVKNKTVINNKSMQKNKKNTLVADVGKLKNNNEKEPTKIEKKVQEYIRNGNLKTTINISLSSVNDINVKEIKQMEAYKIARDSFQQIHKRKFKNIATQNDIYVTNSDIKEAINTIYTFTNQRKYLKENLSIYSYLDKIIENAQQISTTTELKGRNKYKNWDYYITPVNIENNKFIVEFDTVTREDGEIHFRIERLYKIDEGNSTTVVSNTNLTTRFTVESPSVNNSIAQNTKNVKNKTAINNKSMQENKTYTNTSQINENKKSSNFGRSTNNFMVQDIKAITDEFEGKEKLNKNEVSEIWDNIVDNEYEIGFNENGDVESYIDLEEGKNKIIVKRYDNEDNVVDSMTVFSKDGKFYTDEIKNAIKQVATVYDENKPIKGQVDIEGNEVRSMKKKMILSKTTKSKMIDL